MKRLNILIVDDNEAKSKDIAELLTAEVGAVNIKLSMVNCTAVAGRMLKESYFDLLILDIAVPRLEGEKPDRMGGIKFFDEIANREGYLLPGHIVGITAYDDVMVEAGNRLASDLWSLVYYGDADNEWKSQLQRHVRYILRAKAAADGASNFGCDICIITALAEPELAAIRRLPWDWKQIEQQGDATIYFEGRFRKPDGSDGVAVAAHCSGMGMPASAALTTKMALQFRPRVIAMAGICAGNKGEVELGDVIVANPAWDYGSGKVVGTSEGTIFQPAPYPLALTSAVRGVVERAEADSNLRKQIKESYEGDCPNTELQIHIGPFATGSAVVAAKAVLTDIQQQHRKLLAVDMEGYGVLSAAWELPSPQPKSLVIKAVSDFADEEKNDNVRKYAASMSARLLGKLCTDFGLCT